MKSTGKLRFARGTLNRTCLPMLPARYVKRGDMEVYKYCDKNGINILQYKALKISRIDEFNDPYEFKIAMNDNEDINKRVEKLYKYQKESYRVICFSSEYNNLILWSHYSRNHTGILIKFDTYKIFTNEKDWLQEVEYKDDMIEIPNNFLRLSKEKQTEIIYKNPYIKYTGWAYEKEYRAIVRFDPEDNKGYIAVDPNSIMEVILGLHCDLETELRVKDILKRDEYFHVNLMRATLHDKKYMLKYVSMSNRADW